MKIFPSVAFFFIFHLQLSLAQGGMWTWVHGDTTTSPAGNFGTIGIPDPANKPPSFYEPAYWIDTNDNLWIYGGYHASGWLYEALWKYNPYTNIWTWISGGSVPNQLPVYGTQGVPSPLNSPGSRNCPATWTDDAGNLWMYGGYTMGNLTRADLWKFDTTSLEWTWMSGVTGTSVSNTLPYGVPTSVLNPRSVAETNCTWTDNQNQLWMYGGVMQYWLDYYDDVIRYNISTNEWTWIRGGSVGIQPIYGTQGIPDPANNPGSRLAYAKWKDSAGDFYFMNGSTYYSGANDHNDVWRYNSTSDEWTWISGTQLTNDPGSYNASCMNGTPAGRGEDKSAYRDLHGKVWLFGGTTATINDNFNDLWMYDPDSLQYKLMHGSNLLNQPAVYGQLNIADPANIPHSRDGAIMFGDSLCHIFVFGGISRHPSVATFNDVWKFTPDTTCIPCLVNIPVASFDAPNEICPGTCTYFTNTSTSATSFYWTFPGGIPGVSTDASPSGICYNTSGTYDVTLIAVGPNGTDTLTMTNYILVYPNPIGQGILQSGDTLFANQGAVSYQWYHNGNIITGATEYFYIAPEGGNYNLVATDSNNCEVEAVIYDVIASTSPLSLGERSGVRLFPNPVNNKLEISGFITSEEASVSVYNFIGEKVLIISLTEGNKKNYEADVSSLSPGLYFLELKSQNRILNCRFVKQ
jgi:hypothetical protein